MLSCTEEQNKIILRKKTNDMLFSINCFGNLSFYYEEKILCFHSKKGEELLALLACEKGSFVNKKKITELLWEDIPLYNSIDILYKVYSHLKKVFFNYDIPFPIISINNEMRLDMTSIKCDLSIFEELYGHITVIEDLLEAFNIYKSPLLFGQSYNWTEILQGHYEFCYMELLESIYLYYLNRGNYKKAAFFKKKYDNYF